MTTPSNRGAAGPPIETGQRWGRVDQRRIPGLSRLYADYLYDFDRLRRFYPAGRAFDWDALHRAAASIAYPAARRVEMAALLQRQNRTWSPAGEIPAATAELLRQFAQPDAVAIVTGQQVGVLGGPLLALHKAMTAVVLAGRLRARGVNAVPIFWMASQDHDLAEVDHVWALDATAHPLRLQARIEAAASVPVGPLRLGAGITALLDDFERCCGAEPGALADLRACYTPEATLADAFAALFTRWFAPWGLIVFDPWRAAEPAAVWAPYFEQVLERQPELAELLGRRGQELEAAGYHVQVEQTAAATMLFLHPDAARQGLRRHGDGYLLGERPIAAAEARSFIEAYPERVSPAALLRPLLQDVAFPTLAQVTGPAETAYLAQSAVLYAALGVRQPVAWPRVSLTLLDPKSRRLLEKHQLALEQIWNEPVGDLLARQALPPGVEGQVGAMRAGFDRDFARLATELEALDPTLVDATQGAVQKIRHQLEQLESRVARSFARRGGEITAQAQHLSGSLYPDRHLQERQLGIAGWIARYPNLPRLLHDALDPATPDHQTVDL